jgi:hypothetical protein
MKNSYEHLALLSLHSILAVTIVATDIDEALPGLAQIVRSICTARIRGDIDTSIGYVVRVVPYQPALG